MSDYATKLAELTEFCADHLKPQYDAATYATALLEAADETDEAQHFELDPRHTKTGNPATTWVG